MPTGHQPLGLQGPRGVGHHTASGADGAPSRINERPGGQIHPTLQAQGAGQAEGNRTGMKRTHRRRSTLDSDGRRVGEDDDDLLGRLVRADAIDAFCREDHRIRAVHRKLVEWRGGRVQRRAIPEAPEVATGALGEILEGHGAIFHLPGRWGGEVGRNRLRQVEGPAGQDGVAIEEGGLIIALPSDAGHTENAVRSLGAEQVGVRVDYHLVERGPGGDVDLGLRGKVRPIVRVDELHTLQPDQVALGVLIECVDQLRLLDRLVLGGEDERVHLDLCPALELLDGAPDADAVSLVDEVVEILNRTPDLNAGGGVDDGEPQAARVGVESMDHTAELAGHQQAV